MAKKDYPGLVLVPPSDRTILRRRLLRSALFILVLIWCASTLNLWPFASDDNAHCQPGVEEDGSTNSAEECGHPQSVTEPLPNQNKFSLTPVSQAEGLGEPKNSPPVATPGDDEHIIQKDQIQDSTSQSSEPANRTTDSSGVPPTTENITSRMPTSKPALSQESNIRLADRLATQHNPGQNVKPKSSELVSHPVDHTKAAGSHNKSGSNSSTSSPVQDVNIDTRLAEQGDAFAQYRLGRYYAQRDGRQAPESVSWYKKASSGLHRLAEAGNGQAMYVLGVMYAYGRGVSRNTEHARRWLTQAVEQKVTAAQPVLAKLAGASHPNPKATEQAKGLKLQN